MAWSVSNVQTADSYRDTPAKLEGMNAVSVNVQVNGAAVYMQRQPYQHGVSSAAWTPDQMLLPGFYQFRRRLAGIQLRSAIAGLPALVSIEALNARE